MDEHKTKLRHFLDWVLPTPAEVTVYVMLTALTIFLCSQDFIDSILFATGDFNPLRYGISLVDYGLQRLVGERIAGSLSLAIFWGLVGLLVNLLWWVWSTFSTELNNDLVYSRYVHPKDTDPKAQLNDFIKRTVIRTSVAVIGIVYLNFVVSSGWPRVSNAFADIMRGWSGNADVLLLTLTALGEILMLHFMVIITRLVVLRKRVFDPSA